MINAIKVSDLEKSIQIDSKSKITIFKDLNYSFEKGKWISISGPSGSGKTTLLSIISGFLVPSQGNVEIENKNIFNLRKQDRLKFCGSIFGIITQSSYLQPYLTSLDNVVYPYFVNHALNKQSFKRAKDILISLGLGTKISKYPNELSGGELQRISIAKALIKNPSILIADEPTGNLDLETTEKILKLFKEFKDNEKTIIMVTHSKEVSNYADINLRFRNGKIIEN